MRAHRTRTLLSALLLAALVGGCGTGAAAGDDAGSDEPGGGGSAVRGPSPELQDAMVAFAECMRDEGIDVPDPGEGGGLVVGGGHGGLDPADPEFQEAEEECRPILDEAEASMPKPSDEEIAEMRDSMLAFAECMRDHGVDFPDPEFDERGRAAMRFAGDPDDADFEDAQEACAEEMGEGAPGMMRARRATPSGDQ